MRITLFHKTKKYNYSHLPHLFFINKTTSQPNLTGISYNMQKHPTTLKNMFTYLPTREPLGTKETLK